VNFSGRFHLLPVIFSGRFHLPLLFEHKRKKRPDSTIALATVGTPLSQVNLEDTLGVPNFIFGRAGTQPYELRFSARQKPNLPNLGELL